MIAFLDTLKERNYPLYWFGWFCFVAAIVCVVLMNTSSKQVLGINAWIKPFKFFLSSGIFTWSMAWIMVYLKEQGKVSVFNWVVIIVLAFEILYIAFQAYKGELSHFNVSNAFNGFMFSLMGIAISVLTIWTGYIGYLFFVNSFPELSDSYVWGIRLGILFFVIFAFECGMMAARLSHTVGAPDGGSGLPLMNWSTQHGDLRIAHFLGMHALQLLPLAGYYVLTSTRGILIFASIYFVVTSLLLIQALLGRPLIRIPN